MRNALGKHEVVRDAQGPLHVRAVHRPDWNVEGLKFALEMRQKARHGSTRSLQGDT